MVDVGNSQTSIGIVCEDDRCKGPSADGSVPSVVWRIATEKKHTADDIRAVLYPLLSSGGIAPGDINTAVIACVVPVLTKAWQQAVRDLAGGSTATAGETLASESSAGEPASPAIILCSAQLAMHAGLFTTDFPYPEQIGADRVANAIAARSIYGAPACVVDFGTATNMEIVDASGRFLGGPIAPGVMTSAQALFANASLLAQVELDAPQSVVGLNTEDALRAGIVIGEACRIDGLVERIERELGVKLRVIATGGLARMIGAASARIDEVCPNLTLAGLAILARTLA